MTNITKIIKNKRKKLIEKELDAPKKYKIINSFEETTMKDISMVAPFFRPFQPVKPEKRRKLNSFSKINFEYHHDELLDYPTIIQYKIGGDWHLYNRLIGIHIPYCTFDCWHCFNDKRLHLIDKNTKYKSAQEIIKKFIDQRDKDKIDNKDTNVLRITGGEPFLIPELILECLEKLKEEKDGTRIFIWTETNLAPFLSINGEKSFIEELNEESNILEKLSEYNNFAVHPCLHGINCSNIEHITGKKDIDLDHLLYGLKQLLRYKIDIYPTFGSNVCNPDKVPELFEKLFKINDNLPLRFALIEYDLKYKTIFDRFKNDKERKRNPILYSKFTNLKIWNDLLEKHYNVGYAVIPRHIVPLYNDKFLIKKKPTSNYNKFLPKKEIIHIFKSSFRVDYHREILDILTLPNDFDYKLEYDEKYVQEDIFCHSKFNKDFYKNREGLLIYVDMDKDMDKKEGRYYPIRKIKIMNIEVTGNIFVLHFILKDLLIFNNSEDIIKELQSNLEQFYGISNLPPGNKYIFFGEDIIPNKIINENNIKSWQKTVDGLIKYSKFEKSLFYNIKPNYNSKLKIINDNNISKLQTKSGETFSLDIQFYLPNYKNFDNKKPELRKVQIETSHKNIQVVGPNKFYLSKYGSKKIHFRTDEIIEDLEVNIRLWSENKLFDAPDISIPILIKGKKKVVTIKTLCSKFAFIVSALGLVLFSENIKKGIFDYKLFIVVILIILLALVSTYFETNILNR